MKLYPAQVRIDIDPGSVQLIYQNRVLARFTIMRETTKALADCLRDCADLLEKTAQRPGENFET